MIAVVAAGGPAVIAVGAASAPATPARALAVIAPRRPAAPRVLGSLARAGAAAVGAVCIYRACFPGAWAEGRDARCERPARDALRDTVEHLIALIAEEDLVPIDGDWLSVWQAEGRDLRDAGVAESGRAGTRTAHPAYVASLPIAVAHGFDVMGWADTGDLSAAELLVGVAGDADSARERLWPAVRAQAPGLRRRVERVCARLHEAEAADAIAADRLDAFGRLPGALADIGLLLAYMWGTTANTFLDHDPFGDERVHEMPWSFDRLRALAAEWRAARAALARVDATLDALHDPDSLGPVLAAFEQTLGLAPAAPGERAGRTSRTTWTTPETTHQKGYRQ